MIKNILLIGVGGQGTILTTKILAAGLASVGYDVKMSEIHGMSQRGGSVTTQIRYGEKVYAPTIGIGEADVLVSFEKMEALRALPFLKQNGQLIMDEREIYPMPVLTGVAAYPYDAIEQLQNSGAQVSVVKATEIAQELGNIRAQNMVLLGALVKSLAIEGIDWSGLVAKYVPAKAKELNLQAFAIGYGI
ncbi:MAG: indolepyruvate oxidoreductase subunit beta [Clostridiales bacterium]